MKAEAAVAAEKAKVMANTQKIKDKQEQIKKCMQAKIDKKIGGAAGGCSSCGGGDKKPEEQKPLPENGKLPKVYGPVGCGCKKCQAANFQKAEKSEKKKKVEKEQIKKAKIKAAKIKAHNHEKKVIDKKVNEQRDHTKCELDVISQKTEKAVQQIMNDAKDTIEKMRESQPGYEEPTPENEMAKAAQGMHEDFEKLQKQFSEMEQEKNSQKEKADKAVAEKEKKEKEDLKKKVEKKAKSNEKKEAIKNEIKKANDAATAKTNVAGTPISPAGIANGVTKIAEQIGKTVAAAPKPAVAAAPAAPAKPAP